MKTKFENTEKEELNKADIKCRFFAQYFGQEVAFIPSYPNGNDLIKAKVSLIKEIQYLQLKEINAKNLKFNVEADLLMTKNHIYSRNNDDTFERNEVDYLRKNGFAIPFEEYSVNDLISFGWLKVV